MHMVQLRLFSTLLLLSTVLGIAAAPPIRRSSSAADTTLSQADTKDNVQIIFRRSNFRAPNGRSKATEIIKHYAPDAPWSTNQDWIIYLGTHGGYYAVPDSTAEHGCTNTKISAQRSKKLGVKRRIIVGTARSLVDMRNMAQASLSISQIKPTGKADLVKAVTNYLRIHWNLQQTDEEKNNWEEIQKKMKEAEDAATEEAARAVEATGPEGVAAAEILMSMKKE